ncbi:MAG: hypothetical protein HY226_06085 [Candidatus Vogelbacteria bacterium]|nr:hypothetical protein [Candidatus Vogelbacteria bacterium]
MKKINKKINTERFALLTVNDKTGIESFAKELVGLGFKIVASRKTAAYLRSHNISVIDVEKITGYPPLVGIQGIKIIHPKIFSGVLADKNKKEDLADLKKYKIPRFEIVACNFYPFEASIAKENIDHDEAIFNLDIGGPAVVRCAAKNYKNVSIITDVRDYGRVVSELKDGEVSLKFRQELSLKAFRYTFKYDASIIKYLSGVFKKAK